MTAQIGGVGVRVGLSVGLAVAVTDGISAVGPDVVVVDGAVHPTTTVHSTTPRQMWVLIMDFKVFILGNDSIARAVNDLEGEGRCSIRLLHHFH